MSDTLHRHIRTLQLVPRAPQRCSVKDIYETLLEEGFDVTRRSIERDLRKLQMRFALETDDNKPAGWWWNKQAAQFQIPAIDLHSAVTLSLVDQQLRHLLPRSTLRHLAPQFDEAKKVLGSTASRGLPRWPDNVRALPRSQPQEAPDVVPGVIDAVYEALLMAKMLKVTYEPREGQTKEHEVHPLGLVFRDAVGYLICTYWDYSNIVTPTLHRMSAAEVLPKERSIPVGFDIDAYLQSGQLGWQVSGKNIRVSLLVAAEAAPTFVETPLSADQTVGQTRDGRLRVQATVADTRVLRSWLCSFGATVEVEKPKALRSDVAERLASAAGLYR